MSRSQPKSGFKLAKSALKFRLPKTDIFSTSERLSASYTRESTTPSSEGEATNISSSGLEVRCLKQNHCSSSKCVTRSRMGATVTVTVGGCLHQQGEDKLPVQEAEITPATSKTKSSQALLSESFLEVSS